MSSLRALFDGLKRSLRPRREPAPDPQPVDEPEEMTRERMVAFVESLYHPTPLEQVVYDLPEPPDPVYVLRAWVPKAQDEWLPLGLSLVKGYPEEYLTAHECWREKWDYHVLMLLDEWAQVKPDLVLPQVARLLDDPERRASALELFSWVEELPVSRYLSPWVSRAAELSDEELAHLIEACRCNQEPAMSWLLLDLDTQVPPERAGPRAALDTALDAHKRPETSGTAET